MPPGAQQIRSVIADLQDLYPSHPFVEINGSDPYRILISCILSLRTQDAVSLPATERLFAIAHNLDGMVELSVEQIAELIYPVGFYITKAEQILTISQRLLNEYDGQVPSSIDELLGFKGVGRKTANLVLSLGFDLPAICVDTHVHRITNRLGWVNTKAPDETEMALMEIVPKELWKAVNHVFVCHGQNLCKPRRPLCNSCPLTTRCLYGDKSSPKRTSSLP